MPQSPQPEHEASESPEQELAEHASGGYEEGGEPSAEGDIEQLLASLSPEELDQLAAQVSSEMQPEEQAEDPMEGDGNVAELAQAIEQHLAQNPELAAAADTPEKAAALNFVKSASYIEGFLNQAIDRGVSVKTAVDYYDQALTNTVVSIKQAKLKGNQHKLDTNHDGKIDATDLKNLRESKHSVDAKTAAYYEGVLERAREYGFSDYAALNFVKQALDKSAGGRGARARRAARRQNQSGATQNQSGATQNPYGGGEQNPYGGGGQNPYGGGGKKQKNKNRKNDGGIADDVRGFVRRNPLSTIGATLAGGAGLGALVAPGDK
jgi:hypothetical protein